MCFMSILSKTRLKKEFCSNNLGLVYAEVTKYGVIHSQKDLTVGRNTMHAMCFRWINATHHGLQFQIELVGGIIRNMKMSTENNLF